ncbi:hypothetical protein [Nocardia aurea]|uniref:hypothetical protein n=1 Tax=Nocardia aurea TaxID=2144174 RepID=UPI0033AE6FFD
MMHGQFGPPPRPARKRWAIALVIAGAVLGAALASAAVFFGYQAHAARDTGRENTIKVVGSMTLTSSKGWDISGGKCTGSGGYSDIHQGTSVVLKTSSGKVIGVTQLEGGTVSGTGCAFIWVMDKVPDGDAFYTVEVGHRGALSYPRADLTGVLSATLGN